MNKQYVEQRDHDYWIKNTRVSLDSIVFAFLDGLSPESIAKECFPVLTLEQVYGAITYYLANRTEIDAYLKQTYTKFESLQKTIRSSDPVFYQKIAKIKQEFKGYINESPFPG